MGISSGIISTVTGSVGSVTTVNDKTGYSLTAGSYSVRASSTQHGSVSFGASDSDLNVTISSVTVTRAFASGDSRTNAVTEVGQSFISTELTGATTVNKKRGASGTITGTSAAEVMELF